MKTRLKSLVAAAGVAIGLATADAAEAGTVYVGSDTSAGGYTISGSVDVTFDATGNQVTFVVTNSTPFSYSAAELLTAFRFDLSGVTGTGSLTSATTPYARSVASDGSYTDSAGSVNLLGPPKTWELVTTGGLFDLKFNPDAEYSILGAPVGGDYSDSNGGIKNNNGHNPFAYLTATFVLSFTDVTDSAAISDLDLRFGTDFAGSATLTAAPLPPAVLLGLGLLGGLGAVRAIRRRRRPEF